MNSGINKPENLPSLPDLFTMETPYSGQYFPMVNEDDKFNTWVACAMVNSKNHELDLLNPRKAPKMLAIDKVNQWINGLPEEAEQAEIYFYPGVPSSSNDSEVDIDILSKDDFLEMQSRKITRLTTVLYHAKEESVKHSDQTNEFLCDTEFNLTFYNYYSDPIVDSAESNG